MFCKRQLSRISRKCLSAACISQIEQLETRTLFSTYTVTTLGDGIGVVTPVGAGAFDATTLRAAITAANADAGVDTINFVVTGTINLNYTLPAINNDLTIAGPGASKLAVETNLATFTQAFSLFQVNTASTATISGLTVFDGTGSYHADKNGYTQDYGGGIYNDGTLTLTGCILSQNDSANGGGVYSDGNALTITNCTFSDNTSNIGGAIDNNSGKLTVTNSMFLGNRAQDGGGIYNDSALVFSESTLSNNSSGNQPNFGNGGGIDNDGTATLTNSTLSGNGTGYGGGVYNGLTGALTLTTCAVSANSTTYGGGGVYNDGGVVTLTTSTVSQNSASLDGGGIWSSGGLTVSHSAVNDNTAGAASGDGGGIYTSGTLSIDHSTINSNAAYYGGGLYNSGMATFSDGTASDNAALIGAGLYNAGSLSVYGYTIQGNSAGSEGGGVFSGNESAMSSTTLTLQGCNLLANSAKSGGGGLFLETGDASVISSILEGNSAIGGAGADDAEGDLTITTSTISGNGSSNVNSMGGGIENEAGAVSLTLSTVSGNSASLSGGGIYSSGPLDVVNCTLTGNIVTGPYGKGGALWIGDNDINGVLLDSTISGNAASAGGGLFNAAGAILDGDIIAGNTTAPRGKGPPADIAFAVASDSSYNLVGDGSGDLPTGAAYHNLLGKFAHPLNPLLAPLGNYGGPTQTMALLPGSPALDAGYAFDNPGTLQLIATDQRGVSRPQGAAPDIGAFESRRLYPFGGTFHAEHGVTFNGYLGAFADDDPLDTGATAFKITVSWGDGSTSSGSVTRNSSTGNWDLSGSHRYLKKGNYSVSIVIRDLGGFTTTVHSTAAVA